MADKHKYVSELNPFGFHEVLVKISDIKENKKNPRKISAKQNAGLSKSLNKFGLIDKPILNKDLTLIAGHQRKKLYENKGVKEMPCMVPEIQLSKEEAEELLIRHNLNQGEFDEGKLKLFNFDNLVEFGFERSDLKFFTEGEKELFADRDPIYPLSQEPNEEYDYVMIFARNSMEKSFLFTFFDVVKEQCYKSSKVGMGRVVEFTKFEELLQKAINKRSKSKQ